MKARAKKNVNILLIVTGSIAAYKAIEVLRKLRNLNAQVKVILTKGAEQFVRPLNFLALGASEVYTDDNAFSVNSEGVSSHLSVSRWADGILVAPASADFIAKMAGGFADCLACTAVLAFDNWKNVYVAPAMNEKMYDNALTQRNEKFLKSLGTNFIGPASGKLADCSVGRGRMEDPEKIAQSIIFSLAVNGPLSNKKILVTAGATREYIDPVRFISNGSSGTMGFEITKVAKLAGAKVTLIVGHYSAALPVCDNIFFADTTEDMFELTKREFKDADVLIMAAAPVDFKPKKSSSFKLEKGKGSNSVLELVSTPDILKYISRNKGDRVIVGFALQTEGVEKKALRKMANKNMDIVVANSQENLGKTVGSVIIMDKLGNKAVIKDKEKGFIAEKIIDFLIEYTDKEVKDG